MSIAHYLNMHNHSPSSQIRFSQNIGKTLIQTVLKGVAAAVRMFKLGLVLIKALSKWKSTHH